MVLPELYVEPWVGAVKVLEVERTTRVSLTEPEVPRVQARSMADYGLPLLRVADWPDGAVSELTV